MADVIEIVCGIDSNYAPHLAVMLKSLAEYNKKNNFKVHVLHDNIPDDLRKQVADCNKEIDLNWINAADNQVMKFDSWGHISRAAYLRLIMLDVLDPSIKRVLYLDVDIIINGDIRPFWDIDLGDKVCAAVQDAWITGAELAQKWNLPGKPHYFNSGVMLFDLDKLRLKPYMKQAIEILAVPDHGLDYPDQHALNIVLWNDWLAIDPGWNFQRGFLFNHCIFWNALSPEEYQPAIIHYTENFKPWRKSEWHHCSWLYLRTLFKTPFKAAVLKAGGINFYHICRSWLKWTLKRPPMFRFPRRV